MRVVGAFRADLDSLGRVQRLLDTVDAIVSEWSLSEWYFAVRAFNAKVECLLLEVDVSCIHIIYTELYASSHVYTPHNFGKSDAPR